MNPQDYLWFYAPELPQQGEIVLLPEEARHMKAQRIKTEEKVSLFTGQGSVAIGQVIGEGKIRMLEVQEVPKKAFSLAIAFAVPKGERADWMLQKLTELGVSTLIPLKTTHAVVLPREHKQDRWKRILIEACKQSKQAWLPELKPVSTITQAVQDRADVKLLLDKNGQPIRETLNKPVKSILAFIGPEGGFTDEEKAMLQQAGCLPVSLGNNILRIETAALALAAVCAAAQGI